MELTEKGVPELRKIGQELKVKDYNKLSRTELIREIRIKQGLSVTVTKEQLVEKLKQCHAEALEIAKERQSKGLGHSSYTGVSHEIRRVIVKVERL